MQQGRECLCLYTWRLALGLTDTRPGRVKGTQMWDEALEIKHPLHPTMSTTPRTSHDLLLARVAALVFPARLAS